MRQCCIDKRYKEESERSSHTRSSISSARYKFNLSSKSLLKSIVKEKKFIRRPTTKKNIDNNELEYNNLTYNEKTMDAQTINTSILKEHVTAASIHPQSDINQSLVYGKKPQSRQKIRFNLEKSSEENPGLKFHEERRLARKHKFQNRKNSVAHYTTNNQSKFQNSQLLPDNLKGQKKTDLMHSVKAHKKSIANSEFLNNGYSYDNYNQTVGRADMPKFVRTNASKAGFKSSKINRNVKLHKINHPHSGKYRILICSYLVILIKTQQSK